MRLTNAWWDGVHKNYRLKSLESNREKNKKNLLEISFGFNCHVYVILNDLNQSWQQALYVYRCVHYAHKYVPILLSFINWFVWICDMVWVDLNRMYWKLNMFMLFFVVVVVIFLFNSVSFSFFIFHMIFSTHNIILLLVWIKFSSMFSM